MKMKMKTLKNLFMAKKTKIVPTTISRQTFTTRGKHYFDRSDMPFGLMMAGNGFCLSTIDRFNKKMIIYASCTDNCI